MAMLCHLAKRDCLFETMRRGSRWSQCESAWCFVLREGKCQLISAGTHLESFSDSHAECVAVFALGEIEAEIEFVFLADLKSHTSAAGRKKMIASHLTQSRRDLTDPDEGDHAKSPGKSSTILELSRDHVCVDELSRHVAPQCVVGPEDALPVERRVSGRRTIEKVVSENLLRSEAVIVVEGEAIGLE